MEIEEENINLRTLKSSVKTNKLAFNLRVMTINNLKSLTSLLRELNIKESNINEWQGYFKKCMPIQKNIVISVHAIGILSLNFPIVLYGSNYKNCQQVHEEFYNKCLITVELKRNLSYLVREGADIIDKYKSVRLENNLC